MKHAQNSWKGFWWFSKKLGDQLKVRCSSMFPQNVKLFSQCSTSASFLHAELSSLKIRKHTNKFFTYILNIPQRTPILKPFSVLFTFMWKLTFPPLIFPTFLWHSVWNFVASDGQIVDFNKPPFISFQWKKVTVTRVLPKCEIKNLYMATAWNTTHTEPEGPV